jgi:hypothetical protein
LILWLIDVTLDLVSILIKENSICKLEDFTWRRLDRDDRLDEVILSDRESRVPESRVCRVNICYFFTL